jgi:hypothetical protein
MFWILARTSSCVMTNSDFSRQRTSAEQAKLSIEPGARDNFVPRFLSISLAAQTDSCDDMTCFALKEKISEVGHLLRFGRQRRP